MFKTIEGAADCEIRSVIRFLNARNVLPSGINHQICQVYADNGFGCSMKDERTCTISTRKNMCTVFWDRQGVFFVEFLSQDTAINSAIYCETLKKLRRAIQNERRGMLSANLLFLHDIARPHSAAHTQDLIASFGWEQMDHPPYSPDVAPSDFHLFLHLKKFLGGKRFDDDDDLKDAVQKWLTSQAAAFYEEGIQKLVPR